jgi:hypothetical protein
MTQVLLINPFETTLSNGVHAPCKRVQKNTTEEIGKTDWQDCATRFLQTE